MLFGMTIGGLCRVGSKGCGVETSLRIGALPQLGYVAETLLCMNHPPEEKLVVRKNIAITYLVFSIRQVLPWCMLPP